MVGGGKGQINAYTYVHMHASRHLHRYNISMSHHHTRESAHSLHSLAELDSYFAWSLKWVVQSEHPLAWAHVCGLVDLIIFLFVSLSFSCGHAVCSCLDNTQSARCMRKWMFARVGLCGSLEKIFIAMTA